ncbi:MAG: hypothetical protein IT453_09845 [Planctomycetes bacterium]|nr:hypothetical protein [Planctomycetota bacterium]
MKTDTEFWNAVNAALDERRDPLADERVQDELAEHPERLDELLVLQRRLPLLSRAPERRRVTPFVVAAAGLLALGVGLAVAWIRGASEPQASIMQPHDPGDIVDFRLEVVRQRGGLSSSVIVDPHGVRADSAALGDDAVAYFSIERSRGNQP